MSPPAFTGFPKANPEATGTTPISAPGSQEVVRNSQAFFLHRDRSIGPTSVSYGHPPQQVKDIYLLGPIFYYQASSRFFENPGRLSAGIRRWSPDCRHRKNGACVRSKAKSLALCFYWFSSTLQRGSVSS